MPSSLLVRIEIRCKPGKVKELQKKYKICKISQSMAYGDKITKEVFTYYLGKMYSDGEIYTLKEALERIDMSGFKEKTIKLLKEFVTDCSDAKSSAKVIKNYKKSYGNYKVNRIISLLDDIETNFVTVSKADKKELGDYVLPPLELYREIAC